MKLPSVHCVTESDTHWGKGNSDCLPGSRGEPEAERGKWLVQGLTAEPDPEPLLART